MITCGFSRGFCRRVVGLLDFESLASAGAMVKVTMATALTRIGRIFFTFCIMEPPSSVKVIFNSEILSKVCAVV